MKKTAIFTIFIALSAFGMQRQTSLKLCDVTNIPTVLQRTEPPAALQDTINGLITDTVYRHFIQRNNVAVSTQQDMQEINRARGQFVDSNGWKKLAHYGYIFRCPQLPGYILKCGYIHYDFGPQQATHKTEYGKTRETLPRDANVCRVVYQQLMEDVIQRYNLTHVSVPKKYLCAVNAGAYKGVPREQRSFTDEAFVVVAEDLQDMLLPESESLETYLHLPAHERRIYESELRLLFTCAGFNDFKYHNCVFGRDKKIYILDTEAIEPWTLQDSVFQNAIASYDAHASTDQVQKMRADLGLLFDAGALERYIQIWVKEPRKYPGGIPPCRQGIE